VPPIPRRHWSRRRCRDDGLMEVLTWRNSCLVELPMAEWGLPAGAPLRGRYRPSHFRYVDRDGRFAIGR
jgi:hypothetical protein